jgi:hypothetical protein
VTKGDHLSDLPRRIVIRAEKRVFVVWGCAGIGIALASISASSKSATFWYSFTLFTLGWCVLLLWLTTYKITIDQDILSYSVFMRGTIAVSREDILSAKVLPSRFQNAIVIERRLGDPIVVNTKPFSKADLRVVIEFLADKIAQKPGLR